MPAHPLRDTDSSSGFREIRTTPAGKVFEREALEAIEHSRRAISLVQSLERAKRQQLKLGVSVLCDLPRMQSLLQKAQKATPHRKPHVLYQVLEPQPAPPLPCHICNQRHIPMGLIL